MSPLLSRALSAIAGVALAIPMHVSSALAQDYPGMDPPPEYVGLQAEQNRSSCINSGVCDQAIQPGRPAPPPLPDVWGALAISPSTLTWGHSWNYHNEAGACHHA